MTTDAASISEVFEAHGIALTDRQALDLIDDALTEAAPFRTAAASLPAAEAAAYDNAGMPENPGALTRQAVAVAVEFSSLLATAWPVAEAADQLGVTRARLQQMISAREVWAVRRDTQWRLPALQFDGQSLLPGWTKVASALPASLHPLEVLGFLSTPQPELVLHHTARTVTEWLRSGGSPDLAAQLARRLGDTAG